MKVSFHKDKINFSDIENESQREAIESITRSNLSFRSITKNSYLVTKNEKKYTTHELTIFCCDNLISLFGHDQYLKWKEKIIAQFSELSEQFPAREEAFKKIQMLDKMKKQLPFFTRKSNRARYEDAARLLNENITTLEKEIDNQYNERFGKTC